MNHHPIVLCTPACSGGSFIYRTLVSSLNAVGISEISDFWRSADRYMPLDPEAHLLHQGFIDVETFGDLFLKRIESCWDVAQRLERPLLIREHSHRSVFLPQVTTESLKSVSRINDLFAARHNSQLKCIVTVRNPIDSWLGLCANFPTARPETFEEYCLRYIDFIDGVSDTQSAQIFKYEDLIRQPEGLVQQIFTFLDLSLDKPLDWEAVNAVSSSGNSGRQTVQPTLHPRRPFRIEFLREANESESYATLCSRLDYPHLNNDSEGLISGSEKQEPAPSHNVLSVIRSLFRSADK